MKPTGPAFGRPDDKLRVIRVYAVSPDFATLHPGYGSVEDCLKDQALLDKIAADQKCANEVLKVGGTPTFFINGEMFTPSFEEFDNRISSLLKS
jgi:protein-disulfide isomerase